ncbi:alpha-E domain-containing protein [Ectothiorhodospiraceae bacterium BW-2]|nr:alpha-E domain-containing protein [Ectothiorhodospiraceae bacterium BW-2]
MLSRVAENLYWMARYLERVENGARLILVNSNLLMDLPLKLRPGWKPMITIGSADELYCQRYEQYDERSVITFLLNDPENPGSMLSSLEAAREDIRTVRDYLPKEAWEQINELRIYARDSAYRGIERRYRHDYLNQIISRVQQITGLLAGTMIHDEGYEFLKMGRNLERTDMTLRIIDVRSVTTLPETGQEELATFENIQWMTLLKSLSAYQAYRRAMQSRVRRFDVLKFLFKERLFPRALYHTVSEVNGCLQRLPKRDRPLLRVAQMLEMIQISHPDLMDQAQLHQFIDELELALIKINQAISETYFLK